MLGIAEHRAVGRVGVGVVAARWLILALVLALPQGAARAAASEGSELAALQRAAVRVAEADAASLRALRLRVRLSSLLPDVRVSWGYGAQWAYGAGTVATLDGDRTFYSVGLSWNLGKLVFSSREDLALHHEAQRASILRSELVAQVASLYLKRCAFAERLSKATAANANATSAPTLALRLAELDASLEALTGRTHPPRACPSHIERTEASEATTPAGLRAAAARLVPVEDRDLEPRSRTDSEPDPAAPGD